jgi:Cft2 family RNA processing exonuclease
MMKQQKMERLTREHCAAQGQSAKQLSLERMNLMMLPGDLSRGTNNNSISKTTIIYTIEEEEKENKESMRIVRIPQVRCRKRRMDSPTASHCNTSALQQDDRPDHGKIWQK